VTKTTIFSAASFFAIAQSSFDLIDLP